MIEQVNIKYILIFLLVIFFYFGLVYLFAKSEKWYIFFIFPIIFFVASVLLYFKSKKVLPTNIAVQVGMQMLSTIILGVLGVIFGIYIKIKSNRKYK